MTTPTQRARTSVVAATVLAVFGLLTPAMAAPRSAAPAAGAPAQDLVASSVRSGCAGGGRIVLTVTEDPATGSAHLEAAARNLPPGSRWEGALLAGLNPDGSDQEFSLRAVEGRWTVTADFRAVDADEFAVVAFGPRTRLCLAAVFPDSPALGVSLCRSALIAGMSVQRRPRADQILVRYFADRVRPDSRWTLKLRVAEGDHSQAVTISDRAGRGGALRFQGIVEGFDHPRFFARAVGPAGQRCGLGIHPAHITNGATTFKDLDRATQRTLDWRSLLESRR